MTPVLVKLFDNTVLCGECENDKAEREIVLIDARMLVCWDTSVKGLIGICANGVGKACRVTAASPHLRIPIHENVRFVARMTEKAWSSVVSEPWG
jgi:hypothetical protein